MTFTKDSGLVKVWIRKIHQGASIEDVPELFNLKNIVAENVEGIKTIQASEDLNNRKG